MGNPLPLELLPLLPLTQPSRKACSSVSHSQPHHPLVCVCVWFPCVTLIAMVTLFSHGSSSIHFMFKSVGVRARVNCRFSEIKSADTYSTVRHMSEFLLYFLLSEHFYMWCLERRMNDKLSSNCFQADSPSSHLRLSDWVQLYTARFKSPPKWCTHTLSEQSWKGWGGNYWKKKRRLFGCHTCGLFRRPERTVVRTE